MPDGVGIGRPSEPSDYRQNVPTRNGPSDQVNVQQKSGDNRYASTDVVRLVAKVGDQLELT